jgi:signal peptide peptidase SppA
VLEAALDVVLRHGSDRGPAPGAFAARGSSDRSAANVRRESVAVILVRGILAQRANLVDDICGPGSTSTEVLDQAVRAAAADPSVRSIVLDIDSAGGSVYGVQELHATILRARAAKPIAAVANAQALSAAYWIASAAHEVFVTPSGMVGSIGVYMAHVDTSKADEASGKVTTIIKAGKYKAEAEGPLTRDARAHLQSIADSYYSRFVRDVAGARGVSVDAVRSGYGEGRTLAADSALAAGMVDGIATLDQVVGRYARRTAETANNRLSSQAAEARIRIAAVGGSVAPKPGYSAEEARRAILAAAARDPTKRTH